MPRTDIIEYCLKQIKIGNLTPAMELVAEYSDNAGVTAFLRGLFVRAEYTHLTR